MDNTSETTLVNVKKKTGRKPGEKPWLWSIKDPIQREYYYAYIQQKNQANFRNEQYELSFEQYLTIWGENINNRGRRKGQWSMTRYDSTQPWKIGNVFLKLMGGKKI